MKSNDPRDDFEEPDRNRRRRRRALPRYPEDDDRYRDEPPPNKGFPVALVIILSVVGVVLLLGLVVVGLLFTGVSKVRDTAARVESQNNLKRIGIALHDYASMNNMNLPNAGVNAPYFFCGVTAGRPSPAPRFAGGLLSAMEANTKALSAPLDPNVDTAPGLACSYSIPAYWAKLERGTGNLKFPQSFPRGASLCIACAEMTTFGVTYNAIKPFSDLPYTPAVANQASTTANNFAVNGCQVVLADGSTRIVTQAANTPLDWTIACHPDDVVSVMTPNW